MEYKRLFIIGAGANAVDVLLGFSPTHVYLQEQGTGLEIEWFKEKGNDTSTTTVAAGDKTLNTDKGIKMAIMTDNQSAAVVTEDWTKANAIEITSDCTGMTDGKILVGYAEGLSSGDPIIRGVHDGTTSSNTYFEDSSQDFRDQGVVGGQQWIIYNQSNDNYAYVKSVTKPAGKTRYCRIYTSDEAGNATTAADFDTSDVIYLIPKDQVQYPLSDIGAMT
jgi:hypothetical protein